MTPVGLALTIAAAVCGLASGTFCLLYERTRREKRRLWWETETGRNVMAMGASVTLLSSGTVVRRAIPCHTAGEAILAVAYALTAAVMVWRTVMMWRANRPKHRPPANPPSPAMPPGPPPEGRAWYQPTPHSIIEPPHNH